MSYKIKEIADIVGISVRTLHHYDQIGILKPQSVTSGGYRLYSDCDLEKLQQILFFKELDFTLQEIKDLLDHPDFDRKQALETQKQLLIEKKLRLEKIIQSVEKTIHSLEGGIKMSKEEMFDGIDLTEIERHKEKYAQETKQKYGNSDAYKESQKKTASYTKDDWSKILAKQDEIYKKLAALMDTAPSNPKVQQLVSEKRKYITDSFYDCTPEIFRGLGQLYVSDERFTANIDKYKKGLAEFLSKAIEYYCDELNK